MADISKKESALFNQSKGSFLSVQDQPKNQLKKRFSRISKMDSNDSLAAQGF